MSVKYATPLHLNPVKSRLFKVFITLVLFASVVSIVLIPADLWIKLLLLVLCVLVCIRAYRNQAKITRLVWQEDNHWQLHCEGQIHDAELTDNCFVISWLVILHFRLDTGARAYRVICYDALDKALFRQLKVRLKVEGLKNTQHAKMEI